MPTDIKTLFGNPYLLLSIATLGWGGNAVAGKLATGGWQPYTLTCLRWFLVFLMVLPFAWPHIKRDADKLRQRWWVLFSLGAFGMALFNLLMFLALNYTTAINVSIIQASMPVMIMLANFTIMSQRAHWLQIVGLVLSILGVLVTTTSGKPLSFFTSGLNRGDAIMLLGCVFYAGYTFGLRWRPNVHWLSFMCVVALGAFVMSIPFTLFELMQGRASDPDAGDWLVLLYIMTVPSIVSQLCFARGVELIGGNRAGLFINLVPVFGSLLAVLILSEAFRWFHALGMIGVVGGIMLAEKMADKA